MKRRRASSDASDVSSVLRLAELHGSRGDLKKQKSASWTRLLQYLTPRYLVLGGGLGRSAGNDRLPEEIDKFFSVKWVSKSKALVASKCGRLRLVEPMGLALDKPVYIPLPPSPSSTVCAIPGGGIHGLAVDKSHNFLATGGVEHNPESIGLLRLPCMTPLSATGPVHTDWVFNVDWLSSDRLISVSRDGSIVTWKCDSDKLLPIMSQRNAHKSTDSELARIRDCAVFSDNSEVSSTIITLSPNASPCNRAIIWKISEGSYVPLRKYEFPPSVPVRSRLALSPCVCTDLDSESIFALGVSDEVLLFDYRCPKTDFICKAKSIDATQGPIRSISIRDSNLVTCTGATGRLFFYDTRKPSHVLDKYFTAPCAIFAHEWDETGTAVLIAGGGLHLDSNDSFVTAFM
mmetsp:Transcript_13136/g.21319  ORF Transcript_13136/g.21319 Transcript_13136/m.21319 type:complete len:403 (+) Transcript_13136:2187-3395(+)